MDFQVSSLQHHDGGVRTLILHQAYKERQIRSKLILWIMTYPSAAVYSHHNRMNEVTLTFKWDEEINNNDYTELLDLARI